MGRPVHFEYATPDPAREAQFFESAFGWKINRWGDQEYWLVDTGEGPGIHGAIMPQTAPDQPRLVNTVGVENLDAALEKALAAGATVAVGKQEIPTIGWIAFVLSPTGLMIGMLEPLPGSTM